MHQPQSAWSRSRARPCSCGADYGYARPLCRGADVTLRVVRSCRVEDGYARPTYIRRFRSKDAFARHNGTAPLPVWTGNERHRLSRTGNRQLNAAIHRIAITQLRWNPDAAAYLGCRRAAGNTKPEALRALKRRLSDTVYRALRTDAMTMASGADTARAEAA